jgi:hypothetical protein
MSIYDVNFESKVFVSFCYFCELPTAYEGNKDLGLIGFSEKRFYVKWMISYFILSLFFALNPSIE